MRPVRAGKLRTLLSILKPVDEVNSDRASADLGDPGLAYEKSGEGWGEVEGLAGRELFQAQQVRADITCRVTMRYVPGLTTQHRLRIEPTGEILEIASPPKSRLDRRRDLVFLAAEIEGPA